jgi:cytochrome c biogenesis protein CcmG/thiol:disulfide interchange protein DsbE
VVLAVSVDKDEKVYRDFLEANKVAVTTARNPTQDINREYGTVQFPESYIIDRNGRVVEKIISSTNWMDERMVSHVQSML